MSRKNALSFVTALFASVFLSACGSSGTTPSTSNNTPSGSKLHGTCNHTNLANPNERQCREWYGSLYASFDLTVSCSGIGGVYSSEACPKANKVGTCILDQGGAMETRFNYYFTDFSLASAEASCVAKDTTSTGGNLKATWVPSLIAASL